LGTSGCGIIRLEDLTLQADLGQQLGECDVHHVLRGGIVEQCRDHKGPITRAFLEVLEALPWGFHNSRSGCCFPSYEAIAARAECHRDTVCEAIKALEWAGVLTWQHRITRALMRQSDLFGRWSHRWTVIRTSSAYVFRDPQPQLAGVSVAKSENPTGTPNQEIPRYLRPVLRERIGAQSIEQSRGCKPRQAVAGATNHHELTPEPQTEGRKTLTTKKRSGRTVLRAGGFAEAEAAARAANAEPWEPMPGMVKRQCPQCRSLFAAPVAAGEDRTLLCPDCSRPPARPGHETRQNLFDIRELGQICPYRAAFAPVT
jgi:hypothetical protein